MTPLQRLQLRQSEVREKINGILNLETRSDEQRAELKTLTAEAQGLEVEVRAALVAEPEPQTTETRTEVDAEEREIRSLEKRSLLANYVRKVIEGQPFDGVEAEYSAACGVAGMVPERLWKREEAPKNLETRAVTPGPSTVGTTQAAIVPAIFDRSVSAWLGIDMPSAGTGDAAYPVLSTSVTAGPKAKGATAAETPGAFTVGTAEPRRVTGSFKFQLEDAARLAGMETALRMNLSSVLSDAVDNQALNGSGSGDGTVNGLFNILKDPAAPATGAETWKRFNDAFASHIDGLFATDAMGVRGLMGLETYRLMATLFRENESNESVAAYLSRVFGGVRASRRIAAPASNIQQAVIRRSNPAGDRVAVMPVWSGLRLIRDEITGAAEGEVKLTAVALVGDVVLLRPDAFVQDSFRVA